MRAVVQRVSEASVSVENKIISEIQNGILVLLGIEDADETEDLEWLSRKLANLRIFDDENGVMNKNLLDIDGQALVVSQFTLLASTKKGNRPSYIKAAKPEISVPIYNAFVDSFSSTIGKQVKTGVFGADMQVSLINDGPVTIFIDTKNKN